MSTTVTAIETLAAPEDSDLRIRWTRRECAQLVEAGIVEAEKYELLHGELFVKAKNRRHINATNLLLVFLGKTFGMEFLQSQDPIGVSPAENERNAPEPDAAVTRAPVASYTDADPGPEDLRLVVEVTDSTQSRDKVVKARLYANAGIVEYWLLDLRALCLRVHREPNPQTGEFGFVREYFADESIAPLAAPDSPIAVAQLLPAQTTPDM